MDFSISSVIRAPIAEIDVAGEIDMLSAPSLARVLHDCMWAGCRELCLNFASVTFCGSSGVRTLELVRREIAPVNGRLVVDPVSPIVGRVFAITGFRAAGDRRRTLEVVPD
jgi:anti-anti-sigma factor